MNAKPVLGDWEIPRIEAIETVEQRGFVELAVPGMVGSLFQDMNTTPTRIAIRGSLYGDEARDAFLQSVRDKYAAGEAVTFVADIVTATQVEYVVIEALFFAESGLRPDQIDYEILLKESPPPPPPPPEPALPDPSGFGIPSVDDLDAGLLGDAGGFMDSVTGALDAIETLGSLPDLHDPTAPLKSSLDGVSGALGGLGATAQSLQAVFGGGS
jgi:hypothetical protein